MYALVNKRNGAVWQFSAETFEVHESQSWVDVPDEVFDETVDPADWKWNAETEMIEKIVYEAPPVDAVRRFEFPDIGDQLDLLWHDMDEGRIAGKDTSNWYAVVKNIKDRNPK